MAPRPARRHLFAAATSTALVVALLATPAQAAEPAPTPSPLATSPTGRYFVALAPQDSPEVPAGHAPASAGEERLAREAVADFTEELDQLPASVGENVDLTATHTTLWTGAVVEADAQDAAVVAALPGVGAVHPVHSVPGPTPVPDEADASGEAGASGEADASGEAGTVDNAGAVDEAGAADTSGESSEMPAPAPGAEGSTMPARLGQGDGMRLAIIDTGVDVDHPAFGGGSVDGRTRFPNDVVVGGTDFVGDAYYGEATPGGPRPDARPDDCQGHGTHVAGLAAGRPVPGATPVGVAPQADILAYRIFGCSGGTSTDLIVAALEQAYLDGADVVNMSLAKVMESGPDYPSTAAAQSLAERGVVVVAAVGNKGEGVTRPTLYSAGAPAMGPDVISVGSGEAGGVHPFSLWGPSATLDIKPDLLADGSRELSAWPVGKYQNRIWEYSSGTSMAAPVVAGHALLLLERTPALTPEQVRARLVGTAAPVLDASTGRAVPLPQQGAGVLDPGAAAGAPVTASPSRLTLRESSAPQTLDLTFHASTAGAWSIVHEPALALRGEGAAASPDRPVPTVADAEVTVSPSVSLPAGRSARVPVTITAPAGVPAGTVYGGYLALQDGAGRTVARVPYQGMVGDFADLDLLRTDRMKEPMLTWATSCATCAGGVQRYPVEEPPAAPSTFTLAGTSRPNLLFALRYPASGLHAEAVRVTEGGEVPLDSAPLPLLTTGGHPRGFDGDPEAPVIWDGTYRNALGARPDGAGPAVSEAGLVPDGLYRLKFTATHSLPSGDPGDRETWTSPTFRIAAQNRPAAPWLLATTFGPVADREVAFGVPGVGDVYVGDWDGDGVDGLAYRVGNTFHLRETPTSGVTQRTVDYGRAGDTVYVGDWDGNGTDTFAVRRGNVFHFSDTMNGGVADHVTDYGRADDEVVMADWDGDGRTTPAVRRGNFFYFKNSLTGGPADRVQSFGRIGDGVLPGDFDGDGHDTLALRRGTMIYVRNDFETGVAQHEFSFGRAGDTPLVGRWQQGARDTFGLHRLP